MIPILLIEDLNVTFDSIKAVDSVNLTLFHRQTYGLIGPNAAGKTTILNSISGLVKPQRGRISFKGVDLLGLSPWRIAQYGVGRTFQIPRVIGPMTVMDNLLLSFKGQFGESAFRSVTNRRAMMRRDEQLMNRAAQLLNDIGLTGKQSTLAADLSWGQQKLLSFARLLAMDADLLLLDEPTAGISVRELNQLVKMIGWTVAQNKTVVIVEHNWDVLSEVADWIWFADCGRIASQGTPSDISKDHSFRTSYMGPNRAIG